VAVLSIHSPSAADEVDVAASRAHMSERLRRGVSLPNFGACGDARTMAALAAAAEAAGWDGFFIWDHSARPFRTDMVLGKGHPQREPLPAAHWRRLDASAIDGRAVIRGGRMLQSAG